MKEDLLNTIRALPLAEQQALLAELTTALDGEARGTRKRVPVSVSEVRGIAKSNKQPPTDEEIAKSFADYLIEKHS